MDMGGLTGYLAILRDRLRHSTSAEHKITKSSPMAPPMPPPREAASTLALARMLWRSEVSFIGLSGGGNVDGSPATDGDGDNGGGGEGAPTKAADTVGAPMLLMVTPSVLERSVTELRLSTSAAASEEDVLGMRI